MSKKLLSHDLARMLFEAPNQVVMVNGDHYACETEELTYETVQFGSKENGDHAGGVISANTWIKLGR